MKMPFMKELMLFIIRSGRKNLCRFSIRGCDFVMIKQRTFLVHGYVHIKVNLSDT